MSDSFRPKGTVAQQAPPSMGFPMLERVLFTSPRDLPDAGMEGVSPALQEDSLLLSHQGRPSFLVYPPIPVLDTRPVRDVSGW